MKKFNIYAWPAYRNKELNPYNYLIYTQVALQGHKVSEFYLNAKWKRALFKKVISSEYKVFHMHWPSHNILKAKNATEAWDRFLTFYLVMKLMKLYGKKVFWTVHNLENHEGLFPRLQKYIDKLLYSNVDGFITMNKKGQELIQKRIKVPGKQRVIYIPHPHYKKFYKDEISREAAREKLGIPPDRFVFLFLGQIRSYKNVPALIKAFRSLQDSNTELLIAGNVHNDVSRSSLKELIGDAQNIRLHDSFVADDDIQVYLNASDLVVTPYNKIFNSGSVFLNLSFNKPTLAPAMYALAELKEMLGDQWIKTYNGELTAEILEQARKEVIGTKANVKAEPELERFDAAAIARTTIGFYESFL